MKLSLGKLYWLSQNKAAIKGNENRNKLNRTKRVPKPRKMSETGSMEVNKVKRVITGNSSTTSSRMGRRARLTSQGWFSQRFYQII